MLVVDPYGQDWEQSPSGLMVPAKPEKPTAVDLFCGCGGFSLGIMQAGFDVVCGVDNDAAATWSYLVNLGSYPIDMRFVEPGDKKRFEKFLTRGWKKDGVAEFATSGSNRSGAEVPDAAGVPVFWFGDIAKLRGEQILESIGLQVGELDLVVGGPPCQGFSVAGKRNVADPRNNGVFEFARLVCEMRPRALAMENVPGMLSMQTPEGASVIDELAAILERGDFGDFEAMRRLLGGGDVRAVRRGSGRGRKKKRRKEQRKKTTPKSQSQADLFPESEVG